MSRWQIGYLAIIAIAVLYLLAMYRAAWRRSRSRRKRVRLPSGHTVVLSTVWPESLTIADWSAEASVFMDSGENHGLEAHVRFLSRIVESWDFGDLDPDEPSDYGKLDTQDYYQLTGQIERFLVDWIHRESGKSTREKT